MEQEIVELEPERAQVRQAAIRFVAAVQNLVELEPVETIDGIFERCYRDSPLGMRGEQLVMFNAAIRLLTLEARLESAREEIHAT